MAAHNDRKNDRSQFAHLPLSTSGPIKTSDTGLALLNNPRLNKGTAFPRAEREAFGLTAFLPYCVDSLEQQVARASEQYYSRTNSLARNTFLNSLREQNEVLFYKLLQDNLADMFSVVYTPTEGDAIQNFSRLFRRPEGIFLNINDIDRIEHDLSQWGRPEDIDYIVVTDGEEILGIGDQGVGGVLISVAKLILASICGGIHPSRTLPVVLDCGTDNAGLLNDDLYLGLREKRVRGPEYDRFVDSFVTTARKLYPKAYIHFEDFGLTNARRILDKYRPRIACFNDDVQGTGCVTLAAILSGFHVTGQSLSDLRMVVFGAGTAGVGISDQVRDAIAEKAGISREEASVHIWLVDKPGLLTTDIEVSDAQKPFIKDAKDWEGSDRTLLSVIKQVKPNVLVGTSTVHGAFTKEIVQAMAAGTDRPIILPLSNPTRLHEAVPEDILTWTNGRALVATGSPFDPVTGPWGENGSKVTVEIAECNNSVVFPGIGLGAVLCRSSLVTDKMLVAAIQGVSELSPALNDQTAPLLPGVENVRDVSVRVARKVIKQAVAEGVATEKDIPTEDDVLDEWIREQMWDAVYRPLELIK